MDTKQINLRYSVLAEEACCLSCGGAVDYARAQIGETCVDLGSGRGTDVIRMAEEVGQQGFVYGIDISEGMIQKATRQANKLGVQNVKFLQSDLEVLPLPRGKVNLVISNCTINHVENKQKLWDELYRILQPGGRFVVSDIYSIEPVSPEYKNDPIAVSECWAGAVTYDEYMDTLQKSGFSNIKVIEESKPYEKGKVMVSSFTIYGERAKEFTIIPNQ